MGRRRKGRDISGVFLLDKPLGESSNRVLQWVRAIYGASKAGHTGALDPLASGMLPICLGEATKFSQFLLDADKTYEVTATLGVRTDTSDAAGAIVEEKPVTVIEAEIRQACLAYLGKSKQVPSMFSALKHEGKPLYWYARQGITIERPARDIEVFALSVDEIRGLGTSTNVEVDMTVHVSKGTYIRSLVDDIGQDLGCGAFVSKLHRSQVAGYPSNKMLPFAELQAYVEKYQDDRFVHIDALLLPVDTPLYALANNIATEAQTKALKHGMPIASQGDFVVGEQVKVYAPDERLLGVCEMGQDGMLHPKRLVVYNDTSE
jgi:tRNA pseudouridine55 synthase